MSDFDLVAAEFERHRALPDGVTEEIRAALLSLLAARRGSLLDLGAGTGRFGRALSSTADRYVGLDKSYEMLVRFRLSAPATNALPLLLVQADGCFLPFRNDTFAAIMLAHVLSAAANWRELLVEAWRVLEADGVLIVAQRVGPENGIDAQLREQLRNILTGMSVQMPEAGKVKRAARTWLSSVARSEQHLVAAKWQSDCAPRDFLDRHATGVRFQSLAPEVREESLRQLRAWAVAQFGSLDASFSSEYSFELDAYRF